VHDLCVQTRAAELVQQRRLAQAAGLEQMLTRLSQIPEYAGRSRFSEAEELSTNTQFQADHPDGPDIVQLRASLRKRLNWLKSQLSEVMTEREVYYGLFPIVIYTDELVHYATRGIADKWESLQSELYDIDNGGELFYTVIDTLLRKDDTHPLIFELFYFCLKDGFVGMYEGNAGKLQEYQDRLSARIPIERPAQSLELSAGAVGLVPFPWRFYVYAVGAAAIACLALWGWAHYEINAEEDPFEHAKAHAAVTPQAGQGHDPTDLRKPR
jgi:type IV/VI secretion system ImpK/VasF family protein